MILSILSEFLQPKNVALELWIWMAHRNSSILVMMLVCLPSRMWDSRKTPVVRLFVRLDSFGLTSLRVAAQGIRLVIVPWYMLRYIV